MQRDRPKQCTEEKHDPDLIETKCEWEGKHADTWQDVDENSRQPTTHEQQTINLQHVNKHDKTQLSTKWKGQVCNSLTNN